MSTNHIFFLIGIIASLGLFIGMVIFTIKRNKKKKEDPLNIKIKDERFSKIIVNSFSIWMIYFTIFASIICLIFCISMIITA